MSASWELDVSRPRVARRSVAFAPTVWLTGHSGAGKTTIALAVAQHLERRNLAYAILDGDDLRATLNADLSFTRDDRAEQVRRVGHVARILGCAGVIPLVALVSPFRADRDGVRAHHEPGRFLEIHVATPIEVCGRRRSATRDKKGLYAAPRAGGLEQLAGVGQDYEPPERAELVLNGSDGTDVTDLAARVVDAITASLGRRTR